MRLGWEVGDCEVQCIMGNGNMGTPSKANLFEMVIKGDDNYIFIQRHRTKHFNTVNIIFIPHKFYVTHSSKIMSNFSPFNQTCVDNLNT